MLKLKQLVFFLVVFSVAVVNVSAQRACSLRLDYQDLPYWRADFVFTGSVEKFSIDEQAALQSQRIMTSETSVPFHNSVKFAVDKNYRGTVDKNVEITSGFNFKEGEKYFVYAIKGADEKIYQLDDGECGKPPILLEDAKDDIEYAEEIAAGKIGTRIFGFAFEDFQRLGTQRQNIPLANVEVTIKNEKNSFTTQTDETGKYIFKNVPPGKYKIAALTTKGLRERVRNNYYRNLDPSTILIGESVTDELPSLDSARKTKTHYRHSDSRNFVFTSLSFIEGNAVDADGKVPLQQYIWLIPVFNGKIDLGDYMRQVWTNPADGKFVFEDIPEGKYVIAVNRYNCHSDNHPEYSRNFFPGVADLNKAETVTVGENQNVKINDFRLSPTLKERRFSGVVLAADKSPLANATVFLMNSNQKNPNECFSVHTETKTDERGRFQLKGYESYEYKIRAYIQSTEQNSPRLFSKILELSANGNIKNIELTVDSAY